MKLPIILITSVLLFSHCLAEELRTFTNTRGRSIIAKVISKTDDKVTLQFSNGKEVTIQILSLIKKDQQYIRSLKLAEPSASPEQANMKFSEEVEKINSAIGLRAFNHKPFNERNASEFAKALQLPVESTSSLGDSWRLYAAAKKKGYTLFGTIPYSVVLYSDINKKVSSLSLVFANKGDYNSKVGFGAQHFKKNKKKKGSKVSLEDAMQQDYAQISTSLTSALGKAKKGYYGDSGTRHAVLRWDWNGYSFILSLVKKEYVSVIIVSKDKADKEGRSKVIRDSIIKSRLKDSIQKASNGDIYISDIPMVDQGPKGYCAPATFERAMRFIGLEADMYLLAMLGKTKAGGGTSITNLVTEIKSLVLRKGARVKQIKDKKISIEFIKKTIDQGIPLLWILGSGTPFNTPTNENTKLRNKAGHSEWLAKQARIYDAKKKMKANHVCLIIGYNEKTEEIAVSDSWGTKYVMRWTPLSVAKWASSGKFVTIEP